MQREIFMNQKKDIIIFSFTPSGTQQNQRIKSFLLAEGFTVMSFTSSRYANEEILPLPKNPKDFIKSVWGSCDFLFIGAAGIAVRYIAPSVHDKFTDSAVVVMDEKGNYIIPLLSGHMGGAVTLANKISSLTKAIAIHTTATDVQNVFAVDVFAKKNSMIISDRTLAKEISAAILRNEPIGFYSDSPLHSWDESLPAELFYCKTETELQKYPYGICISHRSIHMVPSNTNILTLEPKNITLGIGCRRGVPFSNVETAFLSAIQMLDISPLAIEALASIDIKKEEPALITFSEKYNLPFFTYSSDELKRTQIHSSGSKFVKQVTGVDNVCERSAIFHCPNGQILLPKRIYDKVTISLAERPLHLTFA